MNLSLSPHRRRDILNFVFDDEYLEPVSLVPSQYRDRFSGLFFQCMCHHQSCLTCPVLDFKQEHACSAESDKLTEGLYYRAAVNDALFVTFTSWCLSELRMLKMFYQVCQTLILFHLCDQ